MKNKKNILQFITFLVLFFVGIFSLSGFAFALTVSHSVVAGEVTTPPADSGGGAGAGPGASPAPTPVVTPPVVPPEAPPAETPVVPPEITTEAPPAETPVIPPEAPPEVTPEAPPEIVTPPEAIPSVITDTVDAISNTIADAIDSVSNAVSSVVDSVSNSVSNFANSVSSGAGVVYDAVTAPVSDFLANSPTGQSISNASVIVVEKTKEFVKSPVGKVVTETAKTAGVVSGAAVVATQAVLSTATATVTSLPDLYLMVIRFLGLFSGVSRRKRKPWGTVYDSVTKRPLDPAYVTATKSEGENVLDAITDLDGRYGFLIPPGSYKLKAQKTNYSFPTKMLENVTNDEIYENIYHEESIDVKEGDVVVKNIPLDPIGFDWNEFEKNKQNLFRIYSDRERFWNKLFTTIYLIGILSATAVALFDPSPLNFFLLVVYLLFIIYQSFGQKQKAVSLKKQNGEPLPFAIIKVIIPEINTKIKTAVSDHLGRFYFLVAPGKYYLTIEEKNPDGKYTLVKKTEVIELKGGSPTEDILI